MTETETLGDSRKMREMNLGIQNKISIFSESYRQQKEYSCALLFYSQFPIYP